jgi:hypothetical protein
MTYPRIAFAPCDLQCASAAGGFLLFPLIDAPR